MREPAAPPAVQREVIVCGWKAVAAVFARRPKCVQRLFFDVATTPATGDFCRWLAAERRPYQQVAPEELERIAGTVHHGGIVAVTARPPLRTPRFGDLAQWQREGEPLILLDRVGNPHNLGAIARSAAFFGFTKMILPRHPQQAQPGDAAFRVAEGGLEHVNVYECGALLPFVKQLSPRFLVIGAVVRGGRNLDHAKPPRAPGRPAALLLGNEEEGLDPRVAAQCDLRVQIAGGGAMESLNVSAAAAILLHWVAAGRRGSRRGPPDEAALPPAPAATE